MRPATSSTAARRLVSATCAVGEVRLRISEADWTTLNEHLFQDSGEHGAALLCGHAVIDGVLHLAVREIVPALDGLDYIPGTRGHRHLTGDFVTRHLRRAKDAGLVYLAAHNHGGRDHVAFSRSDLRSHERGYPTLLKLSGAPVGGLVVADHALAGDVWLPDGNRLPVSVTTVIGDALSVITPRRAVGTEVAETGSMSRYARQAMIFGDAGQTRMAQLKVGIVGAGGIGMLVTQALARLGIGTFVILDPDDVSWTNLPRLPEARPRDALGRFGNGPMGKFLKCLGLNKATPKVNLARRIIRAANRNAKVTSIRGDVADDYVARQLRDCDFIFLAADTMTARNVVNQIAFQYLIPTLQVGSKAVINRDTGAVRDIFSVIRSLGAAPGCLWCNGLVDTAKLAEELVANDEQRRNQRYIDEDGVDAPSVITLNSLTAGWAVNDFMHYVSGLGRPATGFRILRNRPVGPGHPQLVPVEPHANPDCHVCGASPHSARAAGDTKDIPTRTGRPRRQFRNG